MKLYHSYGMRVDVIQYQTKLNISELIEAGMELSEVKINYHYY